MSPRIDNAAPIRIPFAFRGDGESSPTANYKPGESIFRRLGITRAEALEWAAHILKDLGYEDAVAIAAGLGDWARSMDRQQCPLNVQNAEMLHQAVLVLARKYAQ